MAERAGYTGVVQGTEMVGYSSSDGYTGVVAARVTSGYTGAAPVTAAPTRVAASRAPTTTPPVRQSRYDQAVQTNPVDTTAPGSTGQPLDLDEVREIDEEDPEPEEAREQPGEDPPSGSVSELTPPMSRDGTETTVSDLIGLVDRIVNLERQARLSPQPTNDALEGARRALTGTLTTAAFGGQHPVHLIGKLATALDDQVEATLATSPPSNLGVAYLHGIGQAVLSGLTSAGSGILAVTQDPIGTAINQARGLIDEIDARVDQGQSVLTAVNGVLNPVSRAGHAWNAAEDLAGAALEAAEDGDWVEATRLSRAAGRQAGGFSAAVVDTATMAAGGAKSLVRRRRLRPTVPRAAPVPPPPPSPRVPASPSTHPAIVPPASVKPQSQPSPPVPPTKPIQPAVPLSLPHKVWTKVPVVSPGKLDALHTYNRALYTGQLQAARQRLLNLTGSRRKRQRAAAMKPVYNTQERLDAIEQQRRNPDRAYLYDVKVIGVETPAGLIKPRQIPGMRAADPKSPGRTFDVYEMRPDGTHRARELKTATTTIESVPKSGGVSVAFNRGSKLGKQLAKTDALQDFATNTGGKIRVIGTALDGSAVELLLDPKSMRSTIVSDYGALIH